MKVMQTVYTLSTLENEAKPGEPVKLLQRHFDQSKDLLIYLTYFLTEVAGYAETDSYVRSNKHLPSKDDLNVNTKISRAALAPKIVAAIQRPRLFPADEFSFPYRYYLRPFK